MDNYEAELDLIANALTCYCEDSISSDTEAKEAIDRAFQTIKAAVVPD